MNSKDNVINQAIKVYLIITIIICFIGRVTPLEKMIAGEINSLIYAVLAGGGAILLFVDLFTTKRWKEGGYIIVLYAFIFVMGISSLINVDYGIVSNIKNLIWTAIQIGLFYTFYKRYSKFEIIIFLDRLWQCISIFWVIPVLYSLGQFITLSGYREKMNATRILRQGFYDNRLFGVFNDPNYAAMISLYVIFACIYLWRKTICKQWKVFLGLNICLQILYITLSGSRTAIVSAVVATCCGGFLIWLRKKDQVVMWKRALCLFVIPVASAIIIYGGIKVVEQTVVVLPRAYYYMVGQTGGKRVSLSKESELNSSLTKRKDGQGHNISNNRATIWKAYVEGLEGDYLFGGSPRNFLVKWQEKEPKGYLDTTQYETHNGYVSVLVGTGIIGAGVLFLFVVLYIRKVVRYLQHTNNIEPEFVFIVIILAAILTYTFFFTELFFVHNITTVLFWLHCGALMHWLDEKKDFECLKNES